MAWGRARGCPAWELPCPPQPQCCVPAATWRTPLKVKQTLLLPFLRPGHPPRLVPTMTSKKYPVASFTDPHLQVQVRSPSRDLAAWHWGHAVTSLPGHLERMPGCDVIPLAQEGGCWAVRSLQEH